MAWAALCSAATSFCLMLSVLHRHTVDCEASDDVWSGGHATQQSIIQAYQRRTLSSMQHKRLARHESHAMANDQLRWHRAGTGKGAHWENEIA